ncbi:MAG: DUF4340 domain-containing protein [Spirochaetota bacterium]|nr:DUF4340 domain-containing protein [Spirochaetota bacterium]
MKKQLLISGIILFIGWGIFTFINRKQVHSKENIIKLSWSNIRKDKFLSLTTTIYKNNTNVYYTITKNQGSWILTEPINISILPEKAALLVNGLLTLTPSQMLTNINDTELNTYGLNSPQLKITGFFDNAIYGFFVGQKTTIGNQFYIKDINNSNTVYLIDSHVIEPFIQGISSIINNKFLTQSTDDILAIKFKNMHQETIELTNENTFWIQKFPEENPNVDWGTKKFLLSLKDLTFNTDSFSFDVDNTILKNLGIDKNSSLMISLLFNNGEYSDLYIGSKTTNNTYPIYISKNNMIAYIDLLMIQNIFGVSTKDLITHK